MDTEYISSEEDLDEDLEDEFISENEYSEEENEDEEQLEDSELVEDEEYEEEVYDEELAIETEEVEVVSEEESIENVDEIQEDDTEMHDEFFTKDKIIVCKNKKEYAVTYRGISLYNIIEKETLNELNSSNESNLENTNYIINDIKKFLKEKRVTIKNIENVITIIEEKIKTKINLNKIYNKEELYLNAFLYIKGLRYSEYKNIVSIMENFVFDFEETTWDEYREKIKQEVLKIKNPIDIKEGMFKCRKCNYVKTKSYAVQLRRADEPPTVFIHCLNDSCNYKWREN